MSTAKTLKKETSPTQAANAITLSAVVTTSSGTAREGLLRFVDDGIPDLALHNPGVESDEIILRVALAKTQAKLWSIINSVMPGKTRITVTQWQVLKIISETPGIGCSAISQKLALLGPSLSRVLNYLADKKYIVIRTAAADRRNKEITITPKGARIITAGNEALGKAGF